MEDKITEKKCKNIIEKFFNTKIKMNKIGKVLHKINVLLDRENEEIQYLIMDVSVDFAEWLTTNHWQRIGKWDGVIRWYNPNLATHASTKELYSIFILQLK